MTPQLSSLLSFLGTLSRGTIFFAEDCLPTGMTLSEIRTHLSAAVQQGHVVRLARGVFLWPSYAEGTLVTLLPEPGDIAGAIAARESIRIAPCEEQCAFLAGLSPGPPEKYKFITDGGNRVVHLCTGHDLVFAWRKESRIFTIKSQTLQRLTLAVRYLGADAMGPSQRARVADILSWASDEEFNDVIWKTPEWVRNILIRERK